MKILLTGASGFIGSHVARSLIHDGHEIHALLRPSSDTSLIADILPNLHVVTGDLLTVHSIPQLSSFDLCLHLAWYVEPGKYLNALCNHEYLRASLALAQRRFQRFVAAGTCFEYALTGEPLQESSPTGPRSIYAQSKLRLYEDLLALNTNFAWVRFAYQYGPGENPQRLVPLVINSLLRNQPAALVAGERIRDYLHVADVGRAVAAVASSTLTGAVNVGSGGHMTVRDVAGTVGELLGRPDLLHFGALTYRDDEPLDVVVDNTRLRSTGWAPQFTLETGLRSTIEWWQRHQEQHRGTSRRV